MMDIYVILELSEVRMIWSSIVSDITRIFGINSHAYNSSIQLLKRAWNNKSYTTLHLFNEWKKIQEYLYGEIVDKELFFIHTYLSWIMRIIRMNVFKISINSNSNNDIFSWLGTDSNIFYKLQELLSNEIEQLDFDGVDRDIFKNLYESLHSRHLRIRRGEYNTPDWLAELVLIKILDKYDYIKSPKLIDPACGTGTFLFHAIRILNKKYKIENNNQIIGIEVNPVMVEIAKTNYLMALGLNNRYYTNDADIPVLCQDTLLLLNNDNNRDLFNAFDIVVGNPPWGSLRDIKNLHYQRFVKQLAIKLNLLNGKDTHLFTQIELATVFFLKSLMFLRENGIIAFVMPRSIITPTMQNYNFLLHNSFDILEILDLEKVKPLFNMPACVLISRKNEFRTPKKNIPLLKYVATLNNNSLTLDEIRHILHSYESEYARVIMEKKSYYYELFKTGVSIFPRSFYFIKPISIHGNKLIEIETSDYILNHHVKDPWKISLRGHVEKDFIYYTLLGSDILPYTYRTLRLVVLPVIKEDDSFKLLRINDMLEIGAVRLAEWFQQVENVWKSRRTSASKERFPTIFDRFNYDNLLEFQSPTRRYIILYSATGRDLAACIIDRKNLPPFRLRNAFLYPTDFIADVKTWFYETNSRNEALYLCAVLNSDVINERIKPLQPRGLGGERAIHRRPLMLSIPKFDNDNKEHKQLVKFAEENIGKITTHVYRGRKELKTYLLYRKNINKLVEKILGE